LVTGLVTETLRTPPDSRAPARSSAAGGVAIVTGMGDLRVLRWRKYGKDRLYVNDEAGLRIGWVDLLTGDATIEQPAQIDAFRAAVAAHHAEAATEVADSVDTAAPPLPAVPSPRPSAEPAWVDLASNRPGQGVRELADAELAAMKERSRVGTFIARTFDMKTDERAWRMGAGGEETVGGRLEKLVKHGWHVLHAVPVGDRGADIDHVVIGPGGVFTVNTKSHPDGRVWVGRNSVRVNGHAVPYLRNSRFEAQRAERLLSAAVGFPVPVRPALVFLTGTLIPNVTIKTAPDDVVILDRTDIPGAFKRSSRKLAAEQVARIYDQARRSTTWTTQSAVTSVSADQSSNCVCRVRVHGGVHVAVDVQGDRDGGVTQTFLNDLWVDAGL